MSVIYQNQCHILQLNYPDNRDLNPIYIYYIFSVTLYVKAMASKTINDISCSARLELARMRK